MTRADNFSKELLEISDSNLRNVTAEFLDIVVPGYFYEVPASSTGKYHPSFSLGERGLVRHTKMVVHVLLELIESNTFISSDSRDNMIVACILHDTFKHGYTDCGHTVSTHPVIAAEEWYNYAKDKVSEYRVNFIYNCILQHMGKWGPKIAIDKSTNNSVCDIVHMADYIASRKMFDEIGDIVGEI